MACLAIASATPAVADDFIKAEVHGTLRFETGHGNYIAVVAADKTEIRVWLVMSEDKVRARELEKLAGKSVTARGTIEQLPDNVHANSPTGAIRLRDFTIAAAKP